MTKRKSAHGKSRLVSNRRRSERVRLKCAQTYQFDISLGESKSDTCSVAKTPSCKRATYSTKASSKHKITKGSSPILTKEVIALNLGNDNSNQQTKYLANTTSSKVGTNEPMVKCNLNNAEEMLLPFWWGSLGISNENFGKVDVQVACMSSKHCPEVLKSVCDFPALLPTEVLPRLDVWPKCFSTSPPTDDIIDLYIFSENESDNKVFSSLLDYLSDQDLGLRIVVDDTKLLAFSSRHLPHKYWRTLDKYYLWAVVIGMNAFFPHQEEDPNSIHNIESVVPPNSTNDVDAAIRHETRSSKNSVAQGNLVNCGPMIKEKHALAKSSFIQLRRSKSLQQRIEQRKSCNITSEKSECTMCSFPKKRTFQQGIGRKGPLNLPFLRRCLVNKKKRTSCSTMASSLTFMKEFIDHELGNVDNSNEQAKYLTYTTDSMGKSIVSIAQQMVDPIWRGSISVYNHSVSRVDGLTAYNSMKACPKVLEVFRDLPPFLPSELLPRLDVWPKSFSSSPLTDSIIDFYILPENESENKAFSRLLDSLTDQDLIMKIVFENTTLLVSSSHQLPHQYWRGVGNLDKCYLWGVLIGRNSFFPYQEEDVSSIRSIRSVLPPNLANDVEAAILEDSCKEPDQILVEGLDPFGRASNGGLTVMGTSTISTNGFVEPKVSTDPNLEEAERVPKPKQKRSLRHLAAPVRTLLDSPIERPTKSARKMIMRDDSPEVEHFPTRANTVDLPVGSPTARRMIMRDDSPEVEHFRTRANTIESPVGSPTANTRAAIRRMASKDKSPQVDRSQPSPLASPNGGIRRSLRLHGIIPTSPQDNEAINTNNDKDAQDMEDTIEPCMEKTKPKRGKTNLKAVFLNEPIKVEFNSKGQPIGVESIGMSSFLGPLVREIVPVTITDWRKISPDMKESLWKSIKVRYHLDKTWKRDYVFKTMGALWRSSKSRLVKAIKEAKNEEERLMLKPDNIKSITDWKAFVRDKTSTTFQQKSSRFREIRKKQVPHTTSRKGYARLIEDMVTGTSGSKSTLSRVDVWTKAHKKKNGEPVTSEVGEILEKLDEFKQDPKFSTTANVFEDALTILLGPEKRGTVRGFGRGVNATKLDIISGRDDNINHLEVKCSKMEEQMKHLLETVNLLLKNQGSSTISSEEHSNAHDPEQVNAHFSKQANAPPLSVNTSSQKNKCKLLDWCGSGEVVAEGCWFSSDPKEIVHHVMLGPNAMRVWVDVAKKPSTFLWRPTYAMNTIEEAVGNNIAWPADKVVM